MSNGSYGLSGGCVCVRITSILKWKIDDKNDATKNKNRETARCARLCQFHRSFHVFHILEKLYFTAVAAVPVDAFILYTRMPTQQFAVVAAQPFNLFEIQIEGHISRA